MRKFVLGLLACTTAMVDISAYAAPAFKIYKGAGLVTMGSCHMDECSWSKSIATKIIQNTRSQAILDVTLIGGSSPMVENSRSKIRWNKKPHKVTIVCSYQHPSIGLDDQLDELPLNSSGVPRILESGAELYFNYCHSFTGGNSAGIEKFGYNVQITE